MGEHIFLPNWTTFGQIFWEKITRNTKKFSKKNQFSQSRHHKYLYKTAGQQLPKKLLSLCADDFFVKFCQNIPFTFFVTIRAL